MMGSFLRGLECRSGSQPPWAPVATAEGPMRNHGSPASLIVILETVAAGQNDGIPRIRFNTGKANAIPPEF
jgi:hypothetical protein